MEEFQELTDLLENELPSYNVPACDCIVTKEGQIIYRHSIGIPGMDEIKPPKTYWIYSATKISTCTAAMQLIEQRKLKLADLVSDYLPEFTELTVRGEDGHVRPARTEMTVFHLMTMGGGLDYYLDRPAFKEALALPEKEKTTRNIISALAKDPLVFDPGTHFRYSFCHDVLGAVIEVVAGQRIEDYMKENIFEPLEMKDTTFHPTSEQRARMMTQYTNIDGSGILSDHNQGNEFSFSEYYDSGGAGLMSTAEDYIRLLSTLSMRGVSQNGNRILNPESVDEMASPWLNDVQLNDFYIRSASMRGYSYGLGVRVLIDNRNIISPIGEFGWDGAAGAYAYVDPKNHIAMYYAQQVLNCGPVFFEFHPKLRDTLGRCLKKKYGNLGGYA